MFHTLYSITIYYTPYTIHHFYTNYNTLSTGTVADSAPIIPISAVLRHNIDVVCEYIARQLPVPTRNFTASPRLIVIRSFDVNKPGEDVQSLKVCMWCMCLRWCVYVYTVVCVCSFM
ncbi:hypothetical protein EON65_27640 [archaeon]|nr:MAG: hypothetical protein EON65_27640 [archaeon]